MNFCWKRQAMDSEPPRSEVPHGHVNLQVMGLKLLRQKMKPGGEARFLKRRPAMRLHQSAAPLAQSVRTLFTPACHSRQQTSNGARNGRRSKSKSIANLARYFRLLP